MVNRIDQIKNTIALANKISAAPDAYINDCAYLISQIETLRAQVAVLERAVEEIATGKWRGTMHQQKIAIEALESVRKLGET